MEYLDGISGLRREEDGRAGFVYTILDPAAEGLAERVIAELPLNRELMFYDKSYPSPSDPGAFVVVWRYGDVYFYRRGNHGWSTDWKTMSRRRLIRYLGRSLSESRELRLSESAEIPTEPPRLAQLRVRLKSIFSRKG